MVKIFEFNADIHALESKYFFCYSLTGELITLFISNSSELSSEQLIEIEKLKFPAFYRDHVTTEIFSVLALNLPEALELTKRDQDGDNNSQNTNNHKAVW